MTTKTFKPGDAVQIVNPKDRNLHGCCGYVTEEHNSDARFVRIDAIARDGRPIRSTQLARNVRLVK